jgi:prepilin-type processing-associated H-X9-DG protein
MDYNGGADNTNTLYLTDPRYARLAKYNSAKEIYRCPADLSKSRGLSGPPRVRSMAMSQAVGPNLQGTIAGRGGWLPAPTYRVFISEADMTDPGPANTWVMADEHPDSINDGGLAIKMDQPTMIDYPAAYHNNAGGFAFADGHSEIKKWTTSGPKGVAVKAMYKAGNPLISENGSASVRPAAVMAVRFSNRVCFKTLKATPVHRVWLFYFPKRKPTLALLPNTDRIKEKIFLPIALCKLPMIRQLFRF